jgi:hypothetical protein
MNREVRIDNCKFILEWDYLGSKELTETNNHSQNDWNQTLITRINYIVANIHKNSRRSGPNTLKLHPSLMPLIETLEYYNKDENKISGRFNIITDDKVEQDIIYIYHSDEILLIPIITEATDSDWGMIEFKSVDYCTQEQVDNYINSTQGYIKVINY